MSDGATMEGGHACGPGNTVWSSSEVAEFFGLDKGACFPAKSPFSAEAFMANVEGWSNER